MLFDAKSTKEKYVKFDVTKVLNKKWEVDERLLEKVGLPFFAGTYALAYIIVNIAITATISHMMLWHYHDIKSSWAFLKADTFTKVVQPWKWNFRFWKNERTRITPEEAEEIDPHYRLMLAYKDIPNWWFGAIWIVSVALGLIMIYLADTTLPWWAFFVACAVSSTFLVFFASLTAMFGFQLLVQPFIQMIGAYMLPGKPLANMYFSTFGYNSLYMAQHLLRDLKVGQYAHLSPRCTFTMQLVGTVVGCTMSYVMMEIITTDKKDILMSIQGSNVWSGQAIQSVNTVVSLPLLS
jgi:hypothetical protein